MAKLFNSGKLAGCVVSHELLRKIEKYAAGADKGKQFCQELAAKQLAVFKGLGFAAGYIGGIHKAEASARSSNWPRATARRLAGFLKEIRSRSPTSSSSSSTIVYRHERRRSGSIREYLASLKPPPKSKEAT